MNELRIGGRQCCAQFFSGRIDEIAVYHRSLTDREILDHYLRGAQRLRFQVRSCSDPQCNDQPFSGPDGTSHTYYYIELPNTTPGPAAYTITVSNNRYFQYRTFLESNDLLGNPLGLVNVTVNPGHFGAIPSQGSCSGARTIVCDVGDLPVSGTAQIRLLTDVDPNTGGVFTNTTSVDSPAVDHQTSNNTAVQGPTRVNASADLSITGELLDNVVYAGSDFTYTLHITNAGPLAASSMKIVDALPISVTFKAFDASPGTGCFGTTPVITTVVCQFSSVLPADPITSVYASLVVTVDPSFHGTLTNTASVSAIQDDPNLSNNTLTQTVIALPAADVAIHK